MKRICGMHFQLLWAVLPIPVMAIANSANAAVSERDWKSPGDGLLTYDDVNQREWLDVSVSILDEFPAPRLENAIAEIGPGGLFEGFTWARADDVLSLAASSGVDTSTWDFNTNQVAARHLIDLLGITLDNPPFVRSLGFIDPTDLAIQTPLRAGADVFLSFNPRTGNGGIAGIAVSSNDDFFTPPDNANIVGLMLFRTIPEPGTFLMVTIVGSGVVLASRWRFKK